MDNMDYSYSWAQGSSCYKPLRVMDNMDYSYSWAQGSSCYEQL